MYERARARWSGRNGSALLASLGAAAACAAAAGALATVANLIVYARHGRGLRLLRFVAGVGDVGCEVALLALLHTLTLCVIVKRKKAVPPPAAATPRARQAGAAESDAAGRGATACALVSMEQRDGALHLVISVDGVDSLDPYGALQTAEVA